MKNKFLLKICILALVSAMLLSVFASCNNEGGETTSADNGETTENLGSNTTDGTENVTDDTTDGSETGNDGSVTTEEITTEDITTEDNTTDEITTDESTLCSHPYASTNEGHWKPACDVCGKPEGKMLSHEWDDDVEDEGDLLLYSYYCTVCKHVAYEQEVGYNINVFVAPADLFEASYSGFSEPKIIVEGSTAFARFTANGSSTGSYVSLYRGTAFDDPSGRYLVMKVRVGGSRNSLTLAISSINSTLLDTGAGNTAGKLSITAGEISSGWSTVIIDLAAASTDTKGYIPDATGSYYIDELRVVMEGASMLMSGECFDIAYAMLCESAEEAEAFALSASDGYYKYDDIVASSDPVTSGRVCNHVYTYTDDSHTMQPCDVCGANVAQEETHSIDTMIKGEQHVFGCMCGYELYKMTVPDSVNVFVGAKSLTASAQACKAWSGAETMYEKGTEAFARVYGRDFYDDGKGVTESGKIWDPYTKGTVVSGQYFVIKYRVPSSNGLGQTFLKIYTSTSRNTATDEKDGFTVPVSEDGQWNTVVVDLAHATGNANGTSFQPDANGNYIMKYVQIRLFSTYVANKNCYTDIAFIACCDSLEEARALISADTFYYKSTTTSGSVMSSGGGCITHTVVEVREGNVCNYVCEKCNETVARKQIPESVNKFFSTDYVLDDAALYYQVTPHSFGLDGDTPYGRLVGQGKVGQIIWTRIGGSAASPWPDSQIKEFDVGKAKYLVMKMRSNNDIESVALKIGTIVGDAKYSNIDNQAVADILIPQDVLDGDEWTTFVIDLSNTLSAGWVADSEGNYKVSYFQLTFNSSDTKPFSSTTYFDISYLAFCDSWSEIDELVDESSVRLITGSGTSVESGASGECESHTVVESTDGDKYVYSCMLCQEILFEREVPASVNKYISPVEMSNHTHFNVQSMKTVADGAHPYVRFESALSTHINVWSVASVGGNGQATSIGAETGRYFVMRFRASNISHLALRIGTGGTQTEDVFSSGERVLDGNDWETIVVDLASFANYSCNASADTTVQIRIDGYMAPGASSYTYDVAYVAIVDTVDEAESVITESEYNYYSSLGANPEKRTISGN